jgi:hypothetical protein
MLCCPRYPIEPTLIFINALVSGMEVADDKKSQQTDDQKSYHSRQSRHKSLHALYSWLQIPFPTLYAP